VQIWTARESAPRQNPTPESQNLTPRNVKNIRCWAGGL